MKNLSKTLKLLAELAKVKITVAVSLTTITGFVLASKSLTKEVIIPTFGIFLLACGSSVLNHLQEYKTDKLMDRTKNRPLPSGKIRIEYTILFMSILALAGSLLLFFGSGMVGLFLGLLALVWYNLIYTPLKKISAYAVIPGSVIGAIPPMVGWVAGGGELTDTKVLFVALFFFIWQVPHFWLLVLKYGDDYIKAGFPAITRSHSLRFIKISTFLWIIATGSAALFLPLFGIVGSLLVKIGILLNVFWLIFIFSKILNSSKFSPGKYFMKINYFVLLMIILLMVDHVLI